ncbi:MAG: hypothetical protein AAF402_05525 [Pseudomonadota bacterium]
MPAGSNSSNLFPFSFTVDNAADEGWNIGFSCSRGVTPEGCADVVLSGFYSNDPTAIGTTHYKFALEDTLPTFVDSTGLTLTVLPGQLITGTISTPSGTMAEGDTRVSMQATGLSGPGLVFTRDVTILDDESQATYRLTVPDPGSFAETFRISYLCNTPTFPECAPYLTNGYFDDDAPNNTTELIGNGDIFTDASNYNNINMRMLPAETISGNVTVASAIPAGGLSVTVSARDTGVNALGIFATQIFIPEFGTIDDYSIPVPDDVTASWVIQFSCNEGNTPAACSEYIDVSFYNSTATNNLVFTDVEAEPLAGGVTLSDINVFFATPPTISGTLELTQGIAPEGGLAFVISAKDPVSLNSLTQTFEIPEGEAVGTYQIAVEPDPVKNWRISYDCIEAQTPLCSEVTDKGFYDAISGDTIADENAAGALSGSTNHTDIVLSVVSSLPDVTGLCFPIPAADVYAVICI